jgi:surface protein
MKFKIIKQYIKDLVRNIIDNKIVAKDIDHLTDLMEKEINSKGYECNLNHIDVSNITNMEDLFHCSRFCYFNGDISGWNVSNVENMDGMFHYSSFNGDISKWDVSNVKNMQGMFCESAFSGDISNWDVSNVKKIDFMFLDAACKPPYWAEFEDQETRSKVIAAYNLKKELGQELNDNGISKKKIKI